MAIDSMEITVHLMRTKKTKKLRLEKGSTVEDLLQKMQLKPDTLIVLSNNYPIPMDDILEGDQILTIVQVSSGG